MNNWYLEVSFSPRLQVGLDVTWVQVGYTHQETRPSEGPQFTETNPLLQHKWKHTVKTVKYQQAALKKHKSTCLQGGLVNLKKIFSGRILGFGHCSVLICE